MIPTENSIATQIAELWTSNKIGDASKKELPAYLKNIFLVNNIAKQGNIIIQIYDMSNFKPVYTSPNCLQLTGFTDVELNTNGFLYWIMSLPFKHTLFYIKSAKFVNEKIKLLTENDLRFSNQTINLAYKNKVGQLRSMVSTNSCIDWKDNKQQYQLIMWQDMTGKFKSKDFTARYVIGNETYHYQSVLGKFKTGELITPKEYEVVAFFNTGLSTKDIADELNLSPFTVDNHKKSLLQKLQVGSMADVIEILKFTGIYNEKAL
jgi:DNA-binding CsgD family transcriptional regulator